MFCRKLRSFICLLPRLAVLSVHWKSPLALSRLICLFCFWCQILSMGFYLFRPFGHPMMKIFLVLISVHWLLPFGYRKQFLFSETWSRWMDTHFSVIMPKGFFSPLVLPIWFQESISTCQQVYVASKSIWIKYPRFIWSCSVMWLLPLFVWPCQTFSRSFIIIRYLLTS